MEQSNLQAIILAGGLGTRLQPFTSNSPKPMIEIQGKPFIEYLIIQLKSFGICNILLLLGYLPDVVKDYLGDGSALGVQIEYDITPVEFETGARLLHAKDKIQNDFMLLYCDNYCPIDFQEAFSLFKKSNSMIQLTAYANQEGYTKNNLLIENDRVIVYDKKRVKENLKGVDIGYAFIKKEVISLIPDKNVNFEAAVYNEIINRKQMTAYVTQHRYYSIGSWERIELTKEFFRPKKVVFLDRDGTLNKRPPKGHYIEKAEDFIWLDGAKKALILLKKKGYQIYLITNQAGVARNIVSKDTVIKTHEKMIFELEQAGGSIDQIYCCMHGWDDNCECRKPKPGMLYQAQREHGLNLRECILIGDDIRDIETGIAAHCKENILVSEERTLYDVVQNL